MGIYFSEFSPPLSQARQFATVLYAAYHHKNFVWIEPLLGGVLSKHKIHHLSKTQHYNLQINDFRLTKIETCKHFLR